MRHDETSTVDTAETLGHCKVGPNQFQVQYTRDEAAPGEGANDAMLGACVITLPQD